MAELASFKKTRNAVTFIDLFAGAGGFSEGFLQARTRDKYFSFRLASDINENCELTHRVRYNKMLGLDTKFLCQDIMEDTFLPNLLQQIEGQDIDVVTGGPSCQSFSLAGRRKKLDKRDDLFEHYLKVIKALRPKYFVMENVKGILTKDGGRIRERILHEIRSIIDNAKVGQLFSFLEAVVKPKMTPAQYLILCSHLHIEADTSPAEAHVNSLFDALEDMLKAVTKKMPYNLSKSHKAVNTIRHGILLLKMREQRSAIRKQVIQLKTMARVDNDLFADSINAMVETISDASLLSTTVAAIDEAAMLGDCKEEAARLKEAMHLLALTLDETVAYIEDLLAGDTQGLALFEEMMQTLRLYNIGKPIVVLSSNYGVPQNRERVLFIGSRNDQKPITEIPPTVAPQDRVTVYEALWDMDMIKGGETVTSYRKANVRQQYASSLITRQVQGKPSKKGKLFSDWCKGGRLAHRFKFDTEPFYVKSLGELGNPILHEHHELFNHQTSAQSETVRRRLQLIAQHGDYDAAKDELAKQGLESKKRNYTVLNPMGQSATVCTMPDDFVHYAAARPTTVREMARLQSFDDSFVFQGKRQTGGDKRQQEIPQYTLVGNAVPPLMARAIAETILRNIQ